MRFPEASLRLSDPWPNGPILSLAGRSLFTFEHLREPTFPAWLASTEDRNEAAGEVKVRDAVTILVAEDDELIQAMIEEALSDGGFQSAMTASGEDAISLLQADTSLYRAVITDINLLGECNGWEVAQRAREIDPAMPVIYMTGTHGEDWASRGVPNSVLLVKPFAPAQIVTALSTLLNTAVPPIAPSV